MRKRHLDFIETFYIFGPVFNFGSTHARRNKNSFPGSREHESRHPKVWTSKNRTYHNPHDREYRSSKVYRPKRSFRSEFSILFVIYVF